MTSEKILLNHHQVWYNKYNIQTKIEKIKEILTEKKNMLLWYFSFLIFLQAPWLKKGYSLTSKPHLS
jgi:hypothetical protein